MNMTRREHIQWCKRRALAYLPDNPSDAFASMVSDMQKHPETCDHPAINLGCQLFLEGKLDTTEKMRHFIEGFE